MLSNDAGQPLSESFHSHHHQHHHHHHHQPQHHHRATDDNSRRFDQTPILDQQVPICSSNLSPPQQQQQQQQQHLPDNQNCNSPSLFVKTESASERRYRPQKYCAVCGDRAIACNFNAVTCESCKAFFRRNAFKEQRLKCLFNNRCVINRVTRRFCSKCRILKCFHIGMKREWILTDEQKQMKRVKIMQNKQLKKHSVSSGELYGSVQAVDGPAGAHDNALDADALQLVHLDRDRRMSGSIGSRSDSSVETVTTIRSSNSSNGQAHIEMKDAETSCPDEFELGLAGGDSNKLVHYCSLVPQCQYCFFKLAGPNCEIDEQTSVQQQQQSSIASNPLVAYQQSSNQGATSQTSSVNCGYPIACGSDDGHRNTLADPLSLTHQSNEQNTSPGGEERPSSNCCYLEPVAASNCHQPAAPFGQFIGRQTASSTSSTELASPVEQHGSQMLDPLQLSYLVPNCSPIVENQHQTKLEFCPQACPIQPCVCRKNS